MKCVSQKLLKELNASVIRVGKEFYFIDSYAALPTDGWQVPWVDRQVEDLTLERAAAEGLYAEAAAVVEIPTSFLRHTEGPFIELSFLPDKPTKVGLIGRDGLVGVLPFCRRRKLTLELISCSRAGLEYIWRIKPGNVLYAPAMDDKLKEIKGWPTSLRDV